MMKTTAIIATITPKLELLLLSDCEDELSVGGLIILNVAMVLDGAV